MICELCNVKIEEFSEFQQKLYDNQMKLYRHVEQEADEEDDQDWKHQVNEHNIFEPAADVLDIKPEVVVKVEAADDSENCEFVSSGQDEFWNQQKITNPYQIDLRPSKNRHKNIRKTRETTENDSNQQVPSGYKLCPFCAKILKTHSMYTHVSLIKVLI